MAARARILFVTNTEYGQSNTILALAAELSRRSDVEVHIASFKTLEARVASVLNVTFHLLPGNSYAEGIDHFLTVETGRCPPATRSMASYRIASTAFSTYDGPTYMALYNHITTMIKNLAPALVVCDQLHLTGIEACKGLGQKYIISCPTAASDFTKSEQGAKLLYHYPAVFSGLAYPLSGLDILRSLYVLVKGMYILFTEPRAKALVAYRNAHGLPGPHPLLWPYDHSIAAYITPSIPETDLPFKIPKNLVMCGPILGEPVPLSATPGGQELARWLDNAETVLVNLGSLFTYKDDDVANMLDAFLAGLDSKTQVVWKIKNKDEFAGIISPRLDTEGKRERFRIVDWIDADILSILRHPNVLCEVHHGGANSFFECCSAGVLQILLPQWCDHYDYAVKVEYLGVGVYANKTVAPKMSTVELGMALKRVVIPGKERDAMLSKAREISAACARSGGTRTAVDKIFELATTGRVQ